jgi:hypothetical protein
VSLTDEQRAEIRAAVADWPPLTLGQRDTVATLFSEHEATPPKRGRRESVSARQAGSGAHCDAN